MHRTGARDTPERESEGEKKARNLILSSVAFFFGAARDLDFSIFSIVGRLLCKILRPRWDPVPSMNFVAQILRTGTRASDGVQDQCRKVWKTSVSGGIKVSRVY